MLDIEELGPWADIIIFGSAAVGIVIILLILVCFLVPGCTGYNCIKRKKKKPSTTQKSSNTSEDLNLRDVSYRSWRHGSLYDGNGTINEDVVYQSDPYTLYNPNNVRFDTLNTSSVLNLARKKKDDHREKIFPTEFVLSLRYLPYCKGLTNSKLLIGVESLSGLPPKQYNCTIEPYVTIQVIKQSWSHKKKQSMYYFETKVAEHTANPTFREVFVISSVIPSEMKDWVLNIEAHDRDRYANHTKLCDLQVRLKDMSKVLYNPNTHYFNFHMKSSKQEYGNILLGVSYLPTAQRLSINVMKLRNIKFMPAVSSLKNFNPYVRILMLNGRTGRRVKKEKTNYLRSTAEPEFNETLTFDLPSSQMDTLQFLIILCSKNITEDEISVTMMNEITNDGEDSVVSYRRPKDVCIGKIALGKGVRGVNERQHWFSVLQNPRKLVTAWHNLM